MSFSLGEWLAIGTFILGVVSVLARILVLATRTHTNVSTIMTNHIPHLQADVAEIRTQFVEHLQNHSSNPKPSA